ncbi:MAG TPA: hypothetical protein VFQ77_02140 [Pseudonocardiaceae bacterium]|jgi:hypothetical protein|nr:hypothetical protein [Pseudonocardiaceae bacterium]
MTAIWQESPVGKWTLLTPTGFPDEKTLHDLVAEAPDLLPLSGSPRLIVLGREVLLGSGYADLLAVEPDGRPVIIETKLRNNAESRRAVVAQVLAYAAALHGISAEQFEREVLARHLGGRSLLDVVRESVQEESLGASEFAETLGATLRDGTVRLVLVLDQAPDDLVRLVGYLETVTSGLSVDLVTVAAYEIGDRRVIVPQRVEPERRQRQEAEPVEANRPGRPRIGDLMPGVEPFRAQLATVPNERRPPLERFVAWAQRLADEGLAEVSTYFGKRGEVLLLPRLLPERVGLVSLWRWTDDSALLSLWRSVFERRAPTSIERVESLIAPTPLGKGNTIYDVSDDLLAALYEAYVEANRTRS